MISSARTSVSQLIKAAASIDAEANKRVKEAALEQKQKLAAAQKMAEASLGHGGKAPRKKQQQGALPTNMIFNHSPTSAQLVHVNSVTDSEQNLSTNMDYDKPFVISGLKQLQECFKQDTTFEAEVLAFTTQFTGSSLQATSGRGQLRVTDAGLKSKIYDMFGEVLGAAGDTIMKDSDMTGSNLQKTASPAIFGITANSVYFGFDLSALACIRFTMSGIRSCILARFSLVAKHVSEQSGLINANL